MFILISLLKLFIFTEFFNWIHSLCFSSVNVFELAFHVPRWLITQPENSLTHTARLSYPISPIIPSGQRTVTLSHRTTSIARKLFRIICYLPVIGSFVEPMDQTLFPLVHLLNPHRCRWEERWRETMEVMGISGMKERQTVSHSLESSGGRGAVLPGHLKGLLGSCSISGKIHYHISAELFYLNMTLPKFVMCILRARERV